MTAAEGAPETPKLCLSVKVDSHGADSAGECEGLAVEIVERHGRTEIDADVERFARRERAGDRALDGDAHRGLAVDADRDVRGSAGLSDRCVDHDPMFAGAYRRGGAADIALDHHHVVFVDEIALVHVEREAAGDSAQRIDDARCVLIHLDIRRDAVAFAPEAGTGEFGQPGCRRIESPMGIGDLHPVLRMQASP